MRTAENPTSSHLRSCLSPAVRHAYSRQIQPTDTAAAAALSPQWRWRPPPQPSRQPPLTRGLSDRPTHVVPGTPLQPARGCSSRMRWSVHGSAGVLLNEHLTGADARQAAARSTAPRRTHAQTTSSPSIMPLPAGEASRPPTASVYRIKQELDADGGSAVVGDAIAIGGLGLRPPRRRLTGSACCTHASLLD